MTDYVHITNGSIDIEPTSRPAQWKGSTHNYTGLNSADDAFLLTIGWYPVVQIDPVFDPATETYEDQDISQMVINATDITYTRVVRLLTAGELASIADAEAKASRRNVSNQGGGLPDLRAELDLLKQTLLDQGILTGI